MSVRNSVMRERILAAASKLFQTHGISGVTVQEVADECGLSKAALYHYFSNREQMLQELFGDWARRDMERIRAVAESELAPSDKLTKFVEVHLQSIVENLELYSLSFRSEDELPDSVRKEFRGLKRESDLLVRRIIAEGMQSGDFEPVDERLTVFAIIGMCNWLWKWYQPDIGMGTGEIAEAFSNLILRGLRSDVRGFLAGKPVASDTAAELMAEVAYHTQAVKHHSSRLDASVARLRDLS